MVTSWCVCWSLGQSLTTRSPVKNRWDGSRWSCEMSSSDCWSWGRFAELGSPALILSQILVLDAIAAHEDEGELDRIARLSRGGGGRLARARTAPCQGEHQGTPGEIDAKPLLRNHRRTSMENPWLSRISGSLPNVQVIWAAVRCLASIIFPGRRQLFFPDASLQDHAVVDQPVDRRRRHHRVLEDRLPARERQVARQHHAPALVALGQ